MEVQQKNEGALNVIGNSNLVRHMSEGALTVGVSVQQKSETSSSVIGGSN